MNALRDCIFMLPDTLSKHKGSIIISSAWFQAVTGRGSARLERCVRDAEVPSSNLGAPTKIKTTNDDRSLFFVGQIYEHE